MTEQQYEIAKDMYLQGVSLRQIGDKLNINRKKLSKRLQQDDIITSRFISEDNINKAIEMFNQKKTSTTIAKELNIDRQVLTRELKSRGYITSKMKVNRTTKYDYNSQMAKDIVKDYNAMSMNDLSIKYNVSTNVIQNILAYYNIDTAKQYEGYHCNETIFDVIDTEHKAYWLGFLYADGSVHNEDRNNLELSLKKSDRGHIEKFKSFIESDAPINDRPVNLKGNIYMSSRIIIGNKHLVESLIDKGCTPRKSLTLEFPQLQQHLIPHFMRGYFDGDGSVGVYGGQLRVSVLGTENFLQVYDEYLHNVGVNKTKFGRDGQAYNIQHGGNNQVRFIFDYIYKDASIYLERKYAKFTAVLG